MVVSSEECIELFFVTLQQLCRSSSLLGFLCCIFIFLKKEKCASLPHANHNKKRLFFSIKNCKKNLIYLRKYKV
jgi:hypothetical protein